MKNISEDILKALDNCRETLPLDKISESTGIKINVLVRYLNRRKFHLRRETWDRVYPVVRPYLLLKEGSGDERPMRIGPTARMHKELVDLISDHKVIIDCFGALPEHERTRTLARWRTLAPPEAKPFELVSVSEAENIMLGCFAAMDAAVAQEELLALVKSAAGSVRLRREGL